MYSSKCVIKTKSRTARPDFGEVRLSLNPDRGAMVSVTPGTEGSVTSCSGRGSRDVPLIVQKSDPKGQPPWAKSNQTKILKPVNSGMGSYSTTVPENKNYQARPSWAQTSERQRTDHRQSGTPVSDRQYGIERQDNRRPVSFLSYCDQPFRPDDKISVGRAYDRPRSSLPLSNCTNLFKSDLWTPKKQVSQVNNHYSALNESPTPESNMRKTWMKDDNKKERNRIAPKSSWQRPKNSEMADQKFIDEVVKAHNIYRAKHQCGPVDHAADLSNAAQKWADHLAKTDSFQHSDCNLDGTRMGENIAMKWTSGPDNYTGQEVTDQWYSEVKMHKFGQDPPSAGTGHFTQVVWKGTTEVGVGKAKTKDGKILVVANYRPAGNMLGTFRENVLPPKDGKIDLPPSTDRLPVEHKQGSGPFSSRFENKDTPSNMASRCGESRSVRTFTETSGSGANKVTKTVVEETIIKADGSKTTNRKETITTGDSGSSDMMSIGHKDHKDKDKKGGAFGFFKKDKKGKRSSSSSSSDSSPEREKKPQKIKDFIDDAVKTHNELRKKHGCPPLSHDKNLSKYAQKWAEHLAASNTFAHSDCKLDGDRLGENIACKWSSGSADYSGKDVTEYWYSEIEKHDFSSEPRTLGSGHFTQVVWKGSKKMGIGKAKSSGGKVLVVASYFPAGNMVGSFVENVPRKK